MKSKRFKLIFNVDRPHIAYDILSVLSNNNVGVKSMEVYTYVVYIKTPELTSEIENKIKNDWYQIENLKYIEEIDLMEFGNRELNIKEAIDKLPNGILIVDNLGHIQYTNEFCAERIFNLPIKSLKDINIVDVIDPDNDSLDFNEFKNKFVRKKQIHIKGADYLVDSTPIMVEDNSVLGFVISMTELMNINMFGNIMTFEDIKTVNKEMQLIIEDSKHQSKTDKPLFITGEVGSGKESIARAIHNDSPRSNNPFLYVRCDSKPLKLLDFYLFNSLSHDKESKPISQKTIFEIGNGGTVYFSEIDKLSRKTQIKLIEIFKNNNIYLQDLGINKPVDIRVIMSSSKTLSELHIDNKLDKKVLDFIKNSTKINLPPLRERKDDIPLLTNFFFEDIKKTHKCKYIDSQTQELINNYHWPENIRQLRHVLEDSIINCQSEVLEPEDLCIKEINMSLTQIVNNYEKSIIINALKNNDSIRGTARELDVTHTLLLNRINRYKIQESQWS